MATYQGQTVDVYEDFEDALDGSWSETDSGGNLDPQDASANYAGTYGMSLNLDATVAYFDYSVGSSETDVSVGFWFNPTAMGTNFTESMEIFIAGASAGSPTVRLYYYDVGNVYTLRLRGTGFGANNKTLPSVGAWYWITLDIVQNSTCTLRVYAADESEVDSGTSVTVTANDVAVSHIFLGTNSVTAVSGTLYYDDFVADWTDATYPLLGWSAAGGLSGTSTDGITANDSAVAAATLFASASDAAEFDDSAVVLLTMDAVASDGAEFDDSSVVSAVFQGNVADGAQFNDIVTAALQGILSGTISDGVAFDDSGVAVLTAYADASDGVGFGDAVIQGVYISAVATDGISVDDASTVKAQLSAIAADGVQLSDLASALAHYVASVSDGIELNDVTVEATGLAVGIMSMTASAAGASITVTVSAPSITVT